VRRVGSEAMERRRIQLLDDKAATSVRGSQILGSLSRVIEELVLNSIQGYSNSIVISMRGLDEIIVIDDGLGIDDIAMKDYIGTAYCSSLSDGKGETLRSLASLCVEMKVETACWCLGKFASSRLITSEKVFRDGAVIYCNRFDDNVTTSAIIPKDNRNITTKNSSGTTVTLRGLFHRHAVRRKQYTLQNTLVLTQIASCLRLIALAHPCIAFEMRSSTGSNIDFSFTSSTRTVTESQALIQRLVDMYPDDFSHENTIEVSLDEENVDQSIVNKLSRCSFRAFGAFCITKTDDDESAVVRNKELEIICINGRLATHRDRLADLIIGQLRQGGKSSKYFSCTALTYRLFNDYAYILHFM
jgi:DNA mismatch repair ATPase MutL